MFIEQIQTGCLALGAPLIASSREAMETNSLRNMEVYEEKDSRLGVPPKGVLETAFHAGFVSGHNLEKRNHE